MNQARKTELRALAELFRENGVPTEAVAALLEALDDNDALEKRLAAGQSAMKTIVADTCERCAQVAEARYDGQGRQFNTARSRNYEHAGKAIAADIRTLQELGD